MNWLLDLISKLATHRTGLIKSSIVVKPGYRKGTWGAIAAAVITSGVGYATSRKNKGGGSPEQPNVANVGGGEYYLDPYYGSSQETLSGFGTNLLQGTPNDYYKPIGEIGGQMFEDVLAKGKRDISRSVTEDFARRNVRGARASNVIAKQVGDFSIDARFADMTRALEGRGFLMEQGVGALGGVRSAALTQGGQRNTFNLNQQRIDLEREKFAYSQDADKAGMWSDILGSAIGAGADIYGAYALGKSDKPKKYKDPKGSYNVGYGQGNYPGGYAPNQ